MTEQKNLTCIVCPKECTMEIHALNRILTYVSGHSCERGMRYAREEMLCPSRIVTTTIPIADGVCKRLPVRSSLPLPKERISDWIRLVKELQVRAPVKAGDVLIADVLGSGTDVISSKSVTRYDQDIV